ncbi:MAG: SMP-30/gluconolactonase/LRE family protein [Bacteroidales bacterium]|jgi:gluconolactonase|nr:SMP-30/gluconolactonase/LRE family protein [Bacteroidales bacterium]
MEMTMENEQIKLDVWDDRVRRLISPASRLEKPAEGFRFTEGPVWNETRGCLYFSDIPANTSYCFKPGEGTVIFRKPSNFSNGMTYDRKGRLLACEHHTRRVTREEGGVITTVADRFEGKRLNSPNDVIGTPDGSVLFTDPLYGLQEGLGGPAEEELDFCGVYRVPPYGGEPLLLVSDFEAPNGLALSNDGSKLYVIDSVRKHIRVFAVGTGWKLSGGDAFIEMPLETDGIPGGMKLDRNGNIFCTGPGGIWIYDAAGRLLGRIGMPEVATNLTWGGKNLDELYITASTGLYRINTLTRG